MRIWGAVLFIAIFSAINRPALADSHATADLVAQAQAAPVDHQPELFIKAAEEDLKTSTRLYSDGQVDDARKTLDEMVSLSDRAVAAASQSHKHLKNVEIDLRKISDKLRDLKRTLNFEDQAPVQAAMDHMEVLRTNLLALMFGKGKK
jgi:hypothetical protein